MSDVIFARTRHEYQSYTDYWRLVELSGYKTCYVDEIDTQSDNTYIVTPDNDEVRRGFPNAKARIIWYDLEWHDAPQAPIEGVSEVWHMDAWCASKMGARYVPMGSHVGLKDDAPVTNDAWYDVAYLGYMVGRRAAIGAEMKELGLTVSPSSAWGQERHNVLSKSLMYIHVHQLEAIQGVPALRLVVAAAYSKFVLMESVPQISALNECVWQTDYRFIAGTARDILKDWYWMPDVGEKLHQYLCHDFTFRHSIEAAL
jgi:hypothetical protein